MRKLLNSLLGRHVGTNSWYLCVEIFWATIYASAHAFNGAYAIRLGATNAEMSLLVSVPALIAIVVLVPAGRFLQTRQRRKDWLIGSLFVARAGTLLLVLIPWLHLPNISQGTLLIILLIVWTIPAHFFNLGFIPFLSLAVSEQNRAGTFAARNAISGAVLAVFSFLFGIWLMRIAFPINYQSMYLLAFLLSLISLYYMRKVKTSEIPRVTEKSAGLPLLQSLTSQWTAFRAGMATMPGFGQILVNTILHGIGLWLASPLYLLYFVRTLGAGESWLGLLASMGSIATIAGYIFWRKVMIRWGEPRTLRWTIVLLGLYPLLIGLVPYLPLLLFVGMLNGLIAAGVNLSHFNTFLKLIPEEKQHEYTAFYLTMLNVGAFICPFLGILLANAFGFAPVLIACGVLSIVGSMSFWVWRVGEKPPTPRLAAPEAA